MDDLCAYSVEIEGEMWDLWVEMAGIFVVVPDLRVVAVRQPVPGHPVLLAGVSSTLRYETGDQRRRTNVEL